MWEVWKEVGESLVELVKSAESWDDALRVANGHLLKHGRCIVVAPDGCQWEPVSDESGDIAWTCSAARPAHDQQREIDGLRADVRKAEKAYERERESTDAYRQHKERALKRWGKVFFPGTGTLGDKLEPGNDIIVEGGAWLLAEVDRLGAMANGLALKLAAMEVKAGAEKIAYWVDIADVRAQEIGKLNEAVRLLTEERDLVVAERDRAVRARDEAEKERADVALELTLLMGAADDVSKGVALAAEWARSDYVMLKVGTLGSHSDGAELAYKNRIGIAERTEKGVRGMHARADRLEGWLRLALGTAREAVKAAAGYDQKLEAIERDYAQIASARPVDTGTAKVNLSAAVRDQMAKLGDDVIAAAESMKLGEEPTPPKPAEPQVRVIKEGQIPPRSGESR